MPAADDEADVVIGVSNESVTNDSGGGLTAGLASRGALACGVESDAPVTLPSLVSLRKLVELKVRSPAMVRGAELMERLRAGVPGAGVPSEAEDPPVERLRAGAAGVDGAGMAPLAALPAVAGPSPSTMAATNGRIAAKVGAERFDMRRKPLMVTSGDCVASSCRRGSK